MSRPEERASDQRPAGRAHDVMPIVERPAAGLPMPVIIAGAALIALILFFWLDARRTAVTAPVTTARQFDVPTSAPPPLHVPPMHEVAEIPAPALAQPQPIAPPAVEPRAPAVRLPPPVFAPQPTYVPNPVVPIAPVQREALPRPSGGSVVVFDRSGDGRGGGATATGGQASSAVGDAGAGQIRARAGMFANRATTVTQGTLIPAILETGFNSTRAGSARALVQRDIRGFDGSRILIPRGSRLLGEYQSDVAAGQKRALIMWTRLIRPDGGTIALASPVTDPAGRTGVRARVNTHFFERFSNAFLQTALNVGAAVATRRSENSVVLALPGSFQGASNTIAPATTDIKPTLSLRPGTSISLLAARDLDFTDVETLP